MRWELYLDQTYAGGSIALAAAVVSFGIFSWWYLLQRSSFLAAWRSKTVPAFWALITCLYLVFFVWLCFYWPG